MLVSQQSSLTCKKFFLVKRILLFFFFSKLLMSVYKTLINKVSQVLYCYGPKIFFLYQVFLYWNENIVRLLVDPARFGSCE